MIDDSVAHPGASPGDTDSRKQTRTCGGCDGEGYVPIDHRYDRTTGLLTIVGGLCCCCRGEGEVTVYVHGVAGAGS